MSKNVAVFVDVANIFYAAKAAGVDIDYVTLLKSATAGRDFVRAYAYTGLDPDNENQRQFHSFLARNGYKVISKDIRKYGDGRIKANLDIELVVDMMRMARNLDIAVVVSGDGDFAPAIRAVQQMGVRVEVISFRGNTSSDLIEVADTFTDIAQIARVEKGAGRSGRRVAAEGDLSMTEVPEKETEGAPRRRRGGARPRVTEREDQPAAAVAGGLPANMIVLPGERLSRAPEDVLDEADEVADADEVGLDEGATGEGGEGSEEELTGDGRRRRRRRGGRGRGRARRDGEGEGVGETPVAPTAAGIVDEDEEDEYEELVPAQPPHHTFGSVWDTQLGVPSVSITSAASSVEDEDEDFDDEPEIPEYLLAERRQRGQQRGGQRGRMGGRGRGGAGYQAAVERERYGRGGASSFGGPRPAERQRPGPDRQRGPRPPQQQRSGRPDRPARDQRPHDRQPVVASSGQPWSEVPPEIEELLRAEMARQAPPAGRPAPPQPQAAPVAEPAAEAMPVVEKKPRATRRRAPAAVSTSEAAPTAAGDAANETATTEKPARATRRRTTVKADAPSAEEEKPKRAPRPRRAAASEAAAQPTDEPAAAAAEAAAKPVRRRRTKAEASEAGSSDEG